MWCGLKICEQRDASGATVTKRFFEQGVQEGGASYFYVRDHLGSVCDMTDPAGTLRARYDYDPWGRRTKLTGDKDTDWGFTGHYEHTPSGLTLAVFRAYDSILGRWISEDPAGAIDTLNRYEYVSDEPLAGVDPLGLWGARLPVPPKGCRGKCLDDWFKLHPDSVVRAEMPLSPGSVTSLLSGFTKHGIDRLIERGITPQQILDALKSARQGPFVDELGRAYYKYVGPTATVVTNVARKVITVWGSRGG